MFCHYDVIADKACLIHKFQHTFILMTHTDVKRFYLKKYLGRLHYFSGVNEADALTQPSI